jgi:hypothetical protein
MGHEFSRKHARTQSGKLPLIQIPDFFPRMTQMGADKPDF